LASYDEVLYDTLLADLHGQITWGAVWAIRMVPAAGSPAIKNGARSYVIFYKNGNNILILIRISCNIPGTFSPVLTVFHYFCLP
jgi:hypothetical protein